MFSGTTDASKVALVRLVDWLIESRVKLLDVQWKTPHRIGRRHRCPVRSTSFYSPGLSPRIDDAG
jgi:hypothetical protein